MNISPCQYESDTMTHTVFDETDLKETGDEIKKDAFMSVIATRGVNLTEDTFNSLVLEAFTLNNYVVRAQMLETVLDDLDKGQLKGDNLKTAIKFLTSRIDSAAATLGRMVELVEECKTPGPRH
jgi:hypothetical protein